MGPGGTITAPWERTGVIVQMTTRAAIGAWGSHTDYSAYTSREREQSLDATLAIGHRPWARLELSGALGLGASLRSDPATSERSTGASDLNLRARWEALREPFALPGTSAPPSLGLALAARVPARALALGDGVKADRGALSSATQGLGAFELAVAADVRKTWKTVQIAGIIEGALRAPDEALGIPRMLGPRVLARALLIGFASQLVTVSGFVETSWEGPVSLRGKRVSDSVQRSTSMGASLTLRVDNGFRSGVTVTYPLALSGFGATALATRTVSFVVGYAN
jgi:hypothetical protein